MLLKMKQSIVNTAKKNSLMCNYRISGDLAASNIVMNNTFWIGVQASLTLEMLEFAARKIEAYLGVNF